MSDRYDVAWGLRAWRNWQTRRTCRKLSACRETGSVEPLKFGESLPAWPLLIPSQTCFRAGRCRD